MILVPDMLHTGVKVIMCVDERNPSKELLQPTKGSVVVFPRYLHDWISKKKHTSSVVTFAKRIVEENKGPFLNT